MSTLRRSEALPSPSRRSARLAKETPARTTAAKIPAPHHDRAPAAPLPSRDADDELSHSESAGIGLGIHGEFDAAPQLRPRAPRAQAPLFDADAAALELPSREFTLSSAFPHQYSSQATEPFKETTEERPDEPPRVSPSSSAPTFLVVFGVIVVVLFLGYFFRNLSTPRADLVEQPRLDALLSRYFNSIGVHVAVDDKRLESQSKGQGGISVSAKYWHDFRAAFRVPTCHKPHTLLFFSPDAQKAKSLVQDYIEAFYRSVPSIYLQGDDDESAFRSKLVTFLLETKSVDSSCPTRFVVIDASRGFSDGNRHLIEPALDDTLPQIDLNGEPLETTRVAFVVIREFTRSPDLSPEWRPPLVEQWTGRFMQRLRNVVGYEA